MKKEFDTASTSAHATPAASVTVDAVNFIMDNIFDWDSHKEHAGLRMSYDDCKTLAKSLKTNLEATCPDVHGRKAIDLYGELLHNNWAGEFSDIKDLTHAVVRVYLEAEAGNRAPLESLGRQMQGKINFMERHYQEVAHTEELPVHMLSDAMDKKEEGPRQMVENRVALAQEICGVIDQGTASETSVARRKFPGIFKLVGR